MSENITPKSSIRNPNKFGETMNEKKKALCVEYKTWNTTTAVEYFLALFDEYIAQLEDEPKVDAEGKPVVDKAGKPVMIPALATADVSDLRPWLVRDVNLNGTYNRLVKANVIAKSAEGAGVDVSNIL